MAVATYVPLNRLSDEVLMVIATIACAAGVALPGLLVALAVLVRRAESGGQRQQQAPVMTQPAFMVVPPMQIPPPPPAAGPRRFVVVGKEDAE